MSPQDCAINFLIPLAACLPPPPDDKLSWRTEIRNSFFKLVQISLSGQGHSHGAGEASAIFVLYQFQFQTPDIVFFAMQGKRGVVRLLMKIAWTISLKGIETFSNICRNFPLVGIVQSQTAMRCTACNNYIAIVSNLIKCLGEVCYKGIKNVFNSISQII